MKGRGELPPVTVAASERAEKQFEEGVPGRTGKFVDRATGSRNAADGGRTAIGGVTAALGAGGAGGGSESLAATPARGAGNDGAAARGDTTAVSRKAADPGDASAPIGALGPAPAMPAQPAPAASQPCGALALLPPASLGRGGGGFGLALLTAPP